jgi:acetolactate synthase-1/2/3 large subunit
MAWEQNGKMDYPDFSKQKSSLSGILAEWLVYVGVRRIFFVPGAHIDFLLHFLINDDRFECVSAVHESTAAFMADGAYRSSGKPAAVLSIGGPGAFNMLTAANTCAQEKSPIIFITGDVPSFLQGYGAFQEAGGKSSVITDAYQAAGCHAHRILNIEDLTTAFQGFMCSLDQLDWVPLHLSIPCDIAMSPCGEASISRTSPDHDEPCSLYERTGTNRGKYLKKAVLFLGKEIRDSSVELLKKFAISLEIPVAVTIESISRLSEFPERLRLGIFGYSGHDTATNGILDPTLDLLIIAGVDLNERNTCCWNEGLWHPHRSVYIISQDAGLKWPGKVAFKPISQDQESCITSQLIRPEGHIATALAAGIVERSQWSTKLIQSCPAETTQESDKHKQITMLEACRIIGNALCDENPLFTDAGDHRYFAAHVLSQKPHPRFYVAALTAPMGWAIGAGIGSASTEKSYQTFVITGDGCMLMHGLEISTAVKYHLPVIFIMFENGGYGKIRRRFNQDHTIKKYIPGEIPKIDWSEFFNSIGIEHSLANTSFELTNALEYATGRTGPHLILVSIPNDEPYPNPTTMFSSTSKIFLQTYKINKSK